MTAGDRTAAQRGEVMSASKTPTTAKKEPKSSDVHLSAGGWRGWWARLRPVLGSAPGPLIGLIVLFIAFSFLSPFFLTTNNLINIITQSADIGIMAVGAALVIIIGGIDLSVGSNLAFSIMTSAYLYAMQDWPFALAVLCGLAVGALVGLVNGVLTTYGRIQPFIATLATMSAAAGLALYITNGNPITGFPSWFLQLTSLRPLGIPLQAYLLIAVFVIAAYWLRFRPNGRALYAIGSNEEVARLSGLPVRSLKIRVYVIAGFLAALAGMVVASRLNSAQPTAGTADLLDVIAVVVIGGASLAGGTGSMFGTFIGLLIVGVLNNGMNLMNVSPNLQPVVIGIVIVIAVMTDRRSAAAQSG
jgi:ribose transport system permease protein